jgi:hypothetical protein
MGIGGQGERRGARRAALALDVQLARTVGNDVVARTRDVGPTGASVVSRRPLRIDEELRFDLALGPGGEHLRGVARVLRQHHHDVYALRFEQFDGGVDGGAALRDLVDGAPLH